MKEKRINKYYKTCYPSSIEKSNEFEKKEGGKNPYYFYDWLNHYEKQQAEVVRLIKDIQKDIRDVLELENKTVFLLFRNIFKLYSSVCEYKGRLTVESKPTTRISRIESDVVEGFKRLNFHSSFIRELVSNNRINEAIQAKRFYLNNFKGLVNHFENNFGIEFKQSPLAERVLRYEESIGDSINVEEIKFFQESKVKNKSRKKSFSSFKDMFKETEKDYIKYLKILQDVEPPILDADFSFIEGRLKGAVCVWFDELSSQGVIKISSDRKENANLVMDAISNFTIDESMFTKHQTRAENKYKMDFKAMISSIKLSQ